MSRGAPFQFALVLALVGCAHRGGPPPEDATRDPEFQAAMRDTRPEFPRQADALAAGLYEPFVHPDSLPPPAGARGQDIAIGAPDLSAPAAEGRAPAAVTAPNGVGQIEPSTGEFRGAPEPDYSEDPTTEELLRSLPQTGRAATQDRLPTDGGAGVASNAGGDTGPWTLQLGAFTSPEAARRIGADARAAAPHLTVRTVTRDGLTRVLLGEFPTKSAAEAALRQLAGRPGVASAWVTRAAP